MSGCVNCVWDRYQDEMGEYLAAKKLADAAVRAEKKLDQGGDVPVVSSIDDDGGGSRENWNHVVDENGKQDPFKDVPVGIREFMRLERKLKESTKRI